MIFKEKILQDHKVYPQATTLHTEAEGFSTSSASSKLRSWNIFCRLRISIPDPDRFHASDSATDSPVKHSTLMINTRPSFVCDDILYTCEAQIIARLMYDELAVCS